MSELLPKQPWALSKFAVKTTIQTATALLSKQKISWSQKTKLVCTQGPYTPFIISHDLLVIVTVTSVNTSTKSCVKSWFRRRSSSQFRKIVQKPIWCRSRVVLSLEDNELCPLSGSSQSWWALQAPPVTDTSISSKNLRGNKKLSSQTKPLSKTDVHTGAIIRYCTV